MHSFSSKTSIELIPEESNLPSKSSFHHARFMHVISSRFESIRTTFRNLSKYSIESVINLYSSQNTSKVDHHSKVEIHRLPVHFSSHDFSNHAKEYLLPNLITSSKSFPYLKTESSQFLSSSSSLAPSSLKVFNHNLHKRKEKDANSFSTK